MSQPKTFDDCFASATPEQRAALDKVCKAIRAAAPQAEPGVSYGLAAFRVDGKPLAAVAAAKNHCSYFPMSGKVVAALAAELKGYETSKGGIRFPANKPLPAALVRKLVKARIAEIGGNSTVKHSARVSRPRRNESQTDPAVVAFLSKLDHPLKPAIEAVREIILGVSPDIREGIKWNAPSFRTTDYFATLNLRAKDGSERVWLILHTGAKPKASAKSGVKVADPTGLLEWLAKDRCLVTFADAKDVRAKKAALEAVVREWIKVL